MDKFYSTLRLLSNSYYYLQETNEAGEFEDAYMLSRFVSL